ncbi:ELMO domain-containing protein 3 isoform X2 [Myiozetetes cayanensis]|uniref:ELMO domain-containing protein 3 isoform X2 n=1 Tax=Myiozetetes cayanensis TaxID=478635 RepID=UPI0021603954|nr:ELMO domain-containing protein 3 isoform X2 [Myiozetetes cayanensis]
MSGAGALERRPRVFPPASPCPSRLWGRMGSCRHWCLEQGSARPLGSARSSAGPRRSGRLWKRSSQGWGAPLPCPLPRSPSRRRCSTSRARGCPRAGGRRGGRGAGGPWPSCCAASGGPPGSGRSCGGSRSWCWPWHSALDDSERVHMRILQTIYRQLTRSRRGCPRYGTHWEELGFQGVDPGTDLRGTGMLGLMQILFFVLDSRTLPLAREIFQLSQHETQNFPFCIMSVNITRIVVQALREERLSRECNRRQQVIGVLNDLYAAAFLRLFRLWKRQRGTVADAGSFLKELELSTKKKPRQLLRSLEAYVSHGLRPSSPPPSSSSSQIHFTSICDPVVELERDSRLI